MVLLNSRGSGAPGASGCWAEEASNLLDALSNHLVYPRLNRPQSESGLPAIHVERQRRYPHFCLVASRRRSLVGSSNGFEALVFGYL